MTNLPKIAQKMKSLLLTGHANIYVIGPCLLLLSAQYSYLRLSVRCILRNSNVWGKLNWDGGKDRREYRKEEYES